MWPAEGEWVSNKHCFLTFFHCYIYWLFVYFQTMLVFYDSAYLIQHIWLASFCFTMLRVKHFSYSSWNYEYLATPWSWISRCGNPFLWSDLKWQLWTKTKINRVEYVFCLFYGFFSHCCWHEIKLKLPLMQDFKKISICTSFQNVLNCVSFHKVLFRLKMNVYSVLRNI